MRTRDRMCFQSIRTVCDISRDDQAIIATGSLLTPTDRLKENYSIDSVKLMVLRTCLMISAPPRHLSLNSIAESVSSAFDVFFLTGIM